MLTQSPTNQTKKCMFPRFCLGELLRYMTFIRLPLLLFLMSHSGLGTSQSESRLEDAFSDEENGSGYDGSPTHQSYRPHSFSGYISPGGDLSDEDICGGISTSSGPPGFDYISSGNGSQPSTPHQQQCARSRSGSCASRRSQYR